MQKLTDKVAIITGAARGQGLATGRLFAAEGATVVLTDIRADSFQSVAHEFGDRAQFHAHDVSKQADWETVVSSTLARFGHIDILVNNAGVVHIAPFLDSELSDLERVLNVNLVGTYLGMKSVLPSMLEHQTGSIINISSISGLTGMEGMALYSASKWGVRGLTRSVALEVAGRGVRINSVHPGAIDTPMLNPNADLDPVAAAQQQGIPIGRLGRPDEVAKVSLFLASEDSSYVTGAELQVDGGWTSGVGSEGAVAPAL